MIQTDVVIASTAGVGTTMALADVAPMDPSNPWSLVSYLPALLGPLLLVCLNRLLAIQAAKKQVIAVLKDAEAEQLEGDTDPTNDARAKQLRLEAKLERAAADAMVRG